MTESRSSDAPRVVVVDIGVDAALYSEPGNRVLVLRPGQTFNNAVAAAQRCLPHSHPDTVRTIVRTNLPGAPDFDPPDPTPVRTGPAEPEPAPSRWQQRWQQRSLIPLLAAALVIAVVGTFGIVRLVVGPEGGPFTDEAFQAFARQGEVTCEQLDELSAQCWDPNGNVMISEATIGPRSVVYMFSYGQERIGLRVFADARSAKKWVEQAPTQDMYDGAQAQGRFVLWGTDREKIAEYLKLLRDSQSETETRSGAAAAEPRGSSPTPTLEPIATAAGAPPTYVDPAAMFGELVGFAPARDFNPPPPIKPSSDGLPAALGAVMMGTLGVGTKEADQAAEDGLERALPPVQVIAVKLTLGMPASEEAKPGDEGPSDDAPIETPTDGPTESPEPVDGQPSSEPAGPTTSPTPAPTATPEPTTEAKPTPTTAPQPTSTPTAEPSPAPEIDPAPDNESAPEPTSTPTPIPTTKDSGSSTTSDSPTTPPATTTPSPEPTEPSSQPVEETEKSSSPASEPAPEPSSGTSSNVSPAPSDAGTTTTDPTPLPSEPTLAP